MDNFYDGWLSFWDDEVAERAKAPKVISQDELKWVRTKQDYQAALMVSRENGFITAGATMLGVIPQGWNTGKHSHGEEAIFIIQGEGCSIVDGKRYNWGTRSTLYMPFGSVHQHFNTGNTEVRYLSATGLALERFAGLAKLVQQEEASKTSPKALAGVPKAESDIDPENGRIVLRFEDAPSILGKDKGAAMARSKDEFTLTMPEEMKTPGKSHHTRTIELMKAENGFKAREVEITAILCERPGTHAGKHVHMEALKYVLQGAGYSIMEGKRYDWKQGSMLHIQGPDTVHQDFNTGEVESQCLRIHYGLRAKYFQPIARRTFPYRYLEYGNSGIE